MSLPITLPNDQGPDVLLKQGNALRCGQEVATYCPKSHKQIGGGAIYVDGDVVLLSLRDSRQKLGNNRRVFVFPTETAPGSILQLVTSQGFDPATVKKLLIGAGMVDSNVLATPAQIAVAVQGAGA